MERRDKFWIEAEGGPPVLGRPSRPSGGQLHIGIPDGTDRGYAALGVTGETLWMRLTDGAAAIASVQEARLTEVLNEPVVLIEVSNGPIV
jgi:hypothetical protein